MTVEVAHDEVWRIAREAAKGIRQAVSDRAYRVVLFGSWAMGNAGERSDIDIGIEGPAPVDSAVMCMIREAVETLPTMYTVDVVDLRRVDPSFRALAEGQVVELETAA